MPILELTSEIGDAVKRCRDDYFKFLISFKAMNDLVGEESELVIDKAFYKLLKNMMQDTSLQTQNAHLLGVRFKIVKSVYDDC
jgi:hypothetical protein